MANVFDEALSDVGKDYVESVSEQSRTLNRLWIAILAVAFFALAGEAKEGKRSLPLSLPSVSEQNHVVCSFALLSLLTLSFSVQHAQVMYITRQVHEYLKDNNKQRFFFNSLRVHGITHVASLAELWLWSIKGPRSKFWRSVAVAHYVALKFLSLMASIGFPAFVVIVTAYQTLTLKSFRDSSWITLVVWCVSILVVLGVLQCLYSELVHAWNVISKRLWKG